MEFVHADADADADDDADASSAHGGALGPGAERRQLRLKRKTLQAVLEQCQSALELLRDTDSDSPSGEDEAMDEVETDPSSQGKQAPSVDESESDELCGLLKSRLESPNFLDKLGSIHASAVQDISDDSNSWDVVTDVDLWEDQAMGDECETGQYGFVLVKQEDIADGIACFMAAYLLSLKQTKDLTPNQLQEALSKAFSVKKKEGKLQKAWNASKVIYSVTSWGATAIGLYQNPLILRKNCNATCEEKIFHASSNISKCKIVCGAVAVNLTAEDKGLRRFPLQIYYFGAWKALTGANCFIADITVLLPC